MRTTLSLCALAVALAGTYLVGTGIFMPGGFPPDSWDAFLRPLASTNPVPCLVLAMSIALAYFSVTAVMEGKHEPKPVKASSVLLWGSLFCVVTAAGFYILLLALWRQGSNSQDLGLIYFLAAVQASLGLVLGGGALLANKELRRVTVPVFLIGVLETVCATAVVVHGIAV
jgi:hypothetical protein